MIKKTSLQQVFFALTAAGVLLTSFGCHHHHILGTTVDDPIAVYEYGQSRGALTAVEAEIRTATPQQAAAIEERLLKVLRSSSATRDSKDFCCRMLRRMGSEKSVATLSKMLYDEELAHMARFAMQGMPYASVDRALRKAAGKLDGELQIGAIGPIGARKDSGAVSLLGKLAHSDDRAVADASIAALQKIGSSEATRVLSEL